MSTSNVRAGVNQAQITQTGINFVIFEFIVLGIFAGAIVGNVAGTQIGWGVGIAVFLAGLLLLGIATKIPVVAWLFVGIASLAWGSLFFLLHPMAGVLAFLVSAGGHLAAIDYTRDVNRR